MIAPASFEKTTPLEGAYTSKAAYLYPNNHSIMTHQIYFIYSAHSDDTVTWRRTATFLGEYVLIMCRPDIPTLNSSSEWPGSLLRHGRNSNCFKPGDSGAHGGVYREIDYRKSFVTNCRKDAFSNELLCFGIQINLNQTGLGQWHTGPNPPPAPTPSFYWHPVSKIMFGNTDSSVTAKTSEL